VRTALLGARQYVQPAQNHLASPVAIPLRQFESPLRKRQMHRDSDDLRNWRARRAPIKQILVPILHFPMCRSRGRKTRHRQRRRQNMLPETRVWVLRIKRIDQQGVTRTDRRGRHRRIQERSSGHLHRQPLPFRGGKLWLAHRSTLHHKVSSVKRIIRASPCPALQSELTFCFQIF